MTASASSNQPLAGSALTGGKSTIISAIPPSLCSRIPIGATFRAVRRVAARRDSCAEHRDADNLALARSNGTMTLMDALDFTGRSVVVTGGTRGIGAGIAGGFLAAGAQVLVCARREPAEPPSVDGRTARFVAGRRL